MSYEEFEKILGQLNLWARAAQERGEDLTKYHEVIDILEDALDTLREEEDE